MVCDLLWTNPTPTSGFPKQTISLDLNDYDSVAIVAQSSKTGLKTTSEIKSISIIKVGSAGALVTPSDRNATSGGTLRYYAVTTNGVECRQCPSGEDYSIPMYIYGYKNNPAIENWY